MKREIDFQDFQSWRENFYPTPARLVVLQLDQSEMSELDVQIRATQHSITKWEGARKENLAKHNCKLYRQFVFGGPYSCPADFDYFTLNFLEFASSSCSLCVLSEITAHDNDMPFDIDYGYCMSCPIFQENGKTCGQEYLSFVNSSDPLPMLRLLKKTLHSLVDKRNRLRKNEGQ